MDLQGFDAAGFGGMRPEEPNGKAPVGVDEIGKAFLRLQNYKRGKTRLDTLIKEAEEWFSMEESRRREKDRKRRTNWLMSSIVQKHADFMDNSPEVTILPREKSDQTSADSLTSILPPIMKRGRWEDAYDVGVWHKILYGFNVWAVLWDNDAGNGLGDIVYSATDPLAFYWEPGIRNLQDSHDVFYIHLEALDDLKERYPENAEVQELTAGVTERPQYLHDDNVDVTDKVTVIDWYYKKHGQVHLCVFTGDVILSSTENEGGAGIYRDGRYPFVMDRFLPDAKSPAGVGLYELGRDSQFDLDDANDLFMRHLKVGSRPRYFSAQNGGINEAEFTDLNRDIVHVAAGTVDDRYVRPIETPALPGVYVNMYESKVNELKENTFNRDVNSGGSSGTTTASGIAALQEAGSKSSRDAIRHTYQAFCEIVDMTIERIREFYDAPRSFRILGPNEDASFVSFDNSALVDRQIGAFGEELGVREPVFDYDVRVSKGSVYAKASNNQEILNFFNMGFFLPQNARQALACLEVLQIDNKNKLVEVIKQNDLLAQFAGQILPALLQAAGAVDPGLQQAATQAASSAGLIQPQIQTPQGANVPTENMDYIDRQRAIANERTSPV